MRLKSLLGFLLLLWPPLLLGQFTQVEGTIKDPNGLPYANGTISATLVISGSPRFTFNNLPYTPPSQPTGLDGKGAFEMRLADVNALIPTGGTWSFHICSASGTVQPGSPITSGPVCYDVKGIVVTGNEMDLSAQLSAPAPPLSAPGVGGGVLSINGSPGAFTFSGAGVTCAGVLCTFSGGTGSGTVGLGTPGQYAIYTSPNGVIGSPVLSSNGTIVTVSELIQSPTFQASGTSQNGADFIFGATGALVGNGNAPAPLAGFGGFSILTGGVPAASLSGQNYKAVQLPSEVNGTQFSNFTTATDFIGTAPAVCTGVTVPPNGRCVAFLQGGPNTGQVSAALVGDGSTNCLNGQGVYTPCGGGGGSGTVGPGLAGQFALYNGTNSIVGSADLTDDGSFVISNLPFSVNHLVFVGGTTTPVTANTSLAVNAANLLSYSVLGGPFDFIRPIDFNGTPTSATVSGSLNFNSTTPAAPANGRNITFANSGTSVSAALVGDGSTNCLSGLGTYVPCAAGTSPVGPGVVNQMATYNSTSTVAGSNFFTTTGAALTATGSSAISGIGVDANGVTKVTTGTGGNWVPMSSIQVNGTGMPSVLINYGGVNSMTWGAPPAITPPANGIVLAWGRFNSGGVQASSVNAALVGDGIATDCLLGTGVFNPCPGGAGAGVSSINTVPGAFTFTGAGVSCASTTCTFTGVGTGIGGSGTAPNLAVFTGASSLGNAPITATTSTINFGAGVPLAPTSPATLTAGLKAAVSQSTPSCAGGNLIPLSPTTNVGCAGMDLLYNSNNSGSAGTNVGLIVRSNGATSSGAGLLGMGIAGILTSQGSTTEDRAGYFEADAGQFTGVINTNRGLMGVAVNSSGNVTSNEGIVAQSGVISANGSNANDFSVHCLAPLLGGTMTTHACVKIEAQGQGVEFQTAAHVFANLPPCTSAYEGSLSAITDSAAASGVITGGGTNHVIGVCNGSNWVVLGGAASGGGGTGGAPSAQVCGINNTTAFFANTGQFNFCTFNLPAVAHTYIVRCVIQLDVSPGAAQTTVLQTGINLTAAPLTATKFVATYRDPGASSIIPSNPLMNATNGSQTIVSHSVTGNVTAVAMTFDGVLDAGATAQTVNFWAFTTLAGTNGNLLAGSYCKLD